MITPQSSSHRFEVPFSAVAFATLRADLAILDHLNAQLSTVALTGPVAGSQYAAALTDELGHWAFDIAAAALNVALDNLLAWQSLVDVGVVPAYAHLSMLRTAHESAHFSHWLADASIGLAERTARGVAARAADLDERRKCEAALGLTTATPPMVLASQRLADLMATATARGMTRPNREQVPALIITVPAVVELFDTYETSTPPGIPGGYVYRVLSGFAHAKQWAVTLGATTAPGYDDRVNRLARVEVSDLTTLAVTQRAVTAFEMAVAAFASHH